MHLREFLTLPQLRRVLYEYSTDVKGALFFTAEVLSEEPILKWYKDAHVAKGKSVFLEQMKKFVESGSKMLKRVSLFIFVQSVW